jgi:ABC-type transport system involved in cytochrome c biogenesis permease subunit
VIREVSVTQNILFHIILMALGVVILLGAGFVGKTDKGGKKLNTHKALAGVGIVLVLTGGIGLILTRALRPTLPHFFIAVAAIVFMLLAPIGGLLYVKAVPAKKAALRKSHRIDAMIFYGLVGVAVIFGIIGLHLVRR